MMEAKKRGPKQAGWKHAFEMLKQEHIKISCMLLEMADSEPNIATRDQIYTYLQRTPFAGEVFAQHEAKRYLVDTPHG